MFARRRPLAGGRPGRQRVDIRVVYSVDHPRLIQRALEVNRDQGNIQPVIIVTDKIKGLLNIQTDLPPVKFLYTIIKDYQTITSG